MKKFNFQHPFYQKRCIWRHFQRIFYCLTIENKQCIQKGCAPKFQALKFGMKYSLIGPNQLTKSHWKYIYRTSKLNDKERTELTVCFKSLESNQFVFKQIKRMNDEEQLLRISRSLYFEIKCNNNKKDSFEFFYQKPFLPLKHV